MYYIFQRKKNKNLKLEKNQYLNKSTKIKINKHNKCTVTKRYSETNSCFGN